MPPCLKAEKKTGNLRLEFEGKENFVIFQL